MKLKDSVAHDKEELSVTTLVFRPTKKTPFWKLCTIGASDYNMPVRDIGCGRYANRRNEYIMFISPDVKVKQSSSDWLKLNALLWMTACYPYNAKTNVTVSDTIDFNLPGKYCGTVLLLPEIIDSPAVTKCYTSTQKFISILQVMPITKEQLSEKLRRGQEGTYWLMEQFYTHNDDYELIHSEPFVHF